MRRNFSLISLFLVLFVLSASLVIAGQLVNLEVAKRAAEYHGELLFEKDLKVCDYEVLHWAWGEPAVYVFTLMREGDVYPSNILQDSTLLKGAYLVSSGKKEAGYEKMAQADRYWTVYVGATTDMPSFLKAHAGLPEHVLTQPLMNNLPRDPYWIYGDLFHILVTSRSQMGGSDTKATEIHLYEALALKELGHKKVDTIPAYAEQIEWGRFLDTRADVKAAATGTTVELKVKESNLQGKWWGCAAAAFYNCLKYLEEKGKVRLNRKTASFLQEWISICYIAKFDGKKDYWTDLSNEITGSAQVFRGLNYASKVTYTERKPNPGNFFQLFVSEIKSGYPCALSRSDNEKVVFYKHVTTGIGYWRSGTQVKLIIHDGWPTTVRPVRVKYSGYPESQLGYPQWMLAFRPGKSQKFPTTKPEIKGPDFVGSSETSSFWTWEENLITKNKVPVTAYTYENIFRDSNGTIYHHGKPPWDRIIPYRCTFPYNLSKKAYKTGTKETIYKLLDVNGHLLVAKKTAQLVIGDIYAGPFAGTFTVYWNNPVGDRIKYQVSVNSTVIMLVSGSGTTSDPYNGTFNISGLTIWGGKTELSIFGSGPISGSNGKVVIEPIQGDFFLPDKPLEPTGLYYVLSFTGIKSADAITGAMAFDVDDAANDNPPLVKTITLTRSN